MADIVEYSPFSGSTIGSFFDLVGAATVHAALGDDLITSYIIADDEGDTVVVQGTAVTPPAGTARHAWRLFFQARADVVGALGVYGYFAEHPPYTSGPHLGVAPPATETLYFSDWIYGFLPASEAVTPRWFAQAHGVGIRLVKVGIQIDHRAEPAYAPDVIDGAGVSQGGGTITDTPIARVVFGTIDADDLPIHSWVAEVWDVDGAPVFVWETSGFGDPPATIATPPLANGDYEVRCRVASYIRYADIYPTVPGAESAAEGAGVAETVLFTMASNAPVAPEVTATVTPTPPSVEVEWVQPTSPGPVLFDDDTEVVAEVWREDCNGSQHIATVPAPAFESSWIDRFMSLSYQGVFCGESDHVCEVTYSVRLWGYVDGVLVATDFGTATPVTVDNPTPGADWLRGPISGDLSVCTDKVYGRTRPFGSFQPIGGGVPTVITGDPGCRDYTLTISVTSQADLLALEGILAAPLIYLQLADMPDQWSAPQSETYTVVKVGRVRVASVALVCVAAQPIADPADLVP